jgi:hypothetical protein
MTDILKPEDKEASVARPSESQSFVSGARKEVSDTLAQKLLSETAEEKICPESKIEAPRIFSQKEIVEVVLNALSGSKVPNPEALKLTRIHRNKDNVIVSLESILPDADGKEGFTEIIFVIQGKHSRTIQSKVTGVTISHFYSETEYGSGFTAAEFKDGQWIYTPEKI